MAITTRGGKILLNPCLGEPSHNDDVELEKEINDESPTESEKLRDLEKKSTKLK